MADSRNRKTEYETAVIQSNDMEIRVSVELRETDTFSRKFERTGNWWSCITDLKQGHILGSGTNGSGNLTMSALDIARELLQEKLERGREQ
jgi:hypothetical protein